MAPYERYANLYSRLRERTLARMSRHDRLLGCDSGMHLAHNWYLMHPGKSPAIELIMRRHGILARALTERQDREYARRVRAMHPGSRVSTVRGWESV